MIGISSFVLLTAMKQSRHHFTAELHHENCHRVRRLPSALRSSLKEYELDMAALSTLSRIYKPTRFPPTLLSPPLPQ